ncbi:hypothetical protein [Paenibacillus agricola]|uniref:hypothetical protein n=1 Tax=Paenibacillus agricola TaxID=2716264 RepID=UPI001A9EDB6E|nr:hypothetical protein [Paenibacillus agricola]
MKQDKATKESVHAFDREVKENTNRLEIKLDDHILDARGDIRYLNHRIADAELELKILKNR